MPFLFDSGGIEPEHPEKVRRTSIYVDMIDVERSNDTALVAQVADYS